MHPPLYGLLKILKSRAEKPFWCVASYFSVDVVSIH